MCRRAVLGIGNILLGDEGVGVHVVRRMQAGWRMSSPPDWIEGGTGGIDLALLMEDYDSLVICGRRLVIALVPVPG